MNNDLLHQFRQQLHLLQVDLTQSYIVAVSGGLDSVVLCALCHLSGLSFSMAHCNFHLRGAESSRDEEFVRSLGERYKVPVLVQHFETEKYAAGKGLSVQEAARVLRYQWFEEVRRENGAAYVLLAHHANDNVETLLMHFFRGTGLTGLTGMPQKTNALARCLRPLLSFTRREMETFAHERGLTWVEDSSNRLDKYTRNFFRNTLLPQISKVYPQVEENLQQNLLRFQQTERLYRQLVQKEKEKFLKKEKTEYKVAVQQLLQYKDTSFLYEVIKDFGFGEKAVPELLKLTESPSGKYIQSETHRIIRHRAWLIISPQHQKEKETFLIEAQDRRLQLPDGTLTHEFKSIKHVTIRRDSHIAQLDARQVQFPLLVRRWKEGDYFYPLGMPKKKKLSRFFIDNKLSATEKEAVWVVESANRIIWVVNHRIDDRFKITGSTQKVLQLQFDTA